MADYYGTTTGLTAYWQARGMPAQIGAADDDEKLAALLVASEWLDRSFVNQFQGLKVGQRAQVREWPRIGVQDRYGYAVDSGSIPPEVEAATYEAAGRQIITPGIFFKDYTPGKYKSVAISGAISVDYAIGSAYDFQTQMPQIAAILSGLLACGRGDYSSLSGATARA